LIVWILFAAEYRQVSVPVVLHNLLPPSPPFFSGEVLAHRQPPRRISHCHLSTVLYSVHFVIILAAWGCAMSWWWSHLTLRLLMSYIYGAPILDVSRSHTMTQHSR
jgi:hypothetical protein